MFEMWRRWTYKRYEARLSSTGDFAQFEQFATGPWTPQMVSRMPWDVLVKGPQLGGIDAETRRVIDLEIEKRFRSRQPLLANVISFLALLIAIIAMVKNGNQHDYAKDAIANYGGEEKLLRDLENPKGKTPQQAAAQRNLAKAFREVDARKK